MNAVSENISPWCVENIFTQKWRIQRAFEILKDTKSNFNHFLEFGCDTGYFTRMLENIASQIYSIDKNIKAIEYAKMQTKKSIVKFDTIDFRNFNFENEIYDGISFLECLYYYDQDTRSSLLKKSFSSLTDQGLLAISVPIQQKNISKWEWEESNYFTSGHQLIELLIKHKFSIIKEEIVLPQSPFLVGNDHKFKTFQKFYPFLMRIGNQTKILQPRNYFVLAKKH